LHCYCCYNCGLTFIGDELSSEELQIAYALPNYEQYYEEIFNENKRKMESAINTLTKIIPNDNKIIDIGTGNGLFVKLLLKHGYLDVSAQEIPGTDLRELEKLGCNIYYGFDYKNIPPNSFDLVTILDVAEHVINPREFFQACYNMLTNPGIIYFHTPVVARMDRLVQNLLKNSLATKLGTSWQIGRTNIFHLQIYTPKSLQIMLNQCGFRNISIQIKNELSWPLQRYVKHYICKRLGVNEVFSPFLSVLFYPFLKTNFFNANKAIVMARK
jgi:2-polyprenyl-3-methyl-5-hydroxy-6-metoxy-1,4-benzoquinol methylase